MNCISILQPWAHLILRHDKRIENRSWGTMKRGTLLIHTGKGDMLLRSGEMAAIGADLRARGHTEIAPALQQLSIHAPPLGAIVGVASLIWCTRNRSEAVRIADEQNGHLRFSQEIYAEEGSCYWVLAQVAEFGTPIPYKGERGIFDIPQSVVAHELDRLGWRQA